MTAIAEYPSMLLPAAPPFRVDVPEGFIAHAAPHALAMVRRADGERATPPRTSRSPPSSSRPARQPATCWAPC